MPAQRLSKEKRALILSILAEGTPINAVCRAFKVGNKTVARIIEETGEALNSYMRENFRNLACARIEMDEQWQYVGIHGQRMVKKEADRGDFWLWCAIDPDTKLVFSHMVANRRWYSAESFVEDVAKRTVGPVQVTTDGLASYQRPIRAFFGERASHAIENKVFADADKWVNSPAYGRRQNGIPKTATAERKAVFGLCNLATATTSHIERAFLTVRQELTRFTRCTLAYSKDLRMHKLAIGMHFGIYNLVRKHSSLGGKTPAQAAGLADRRWSLEDVVEHTDSYWQAKEDAAFEAAFAARYKN